MNAALVHDDPRDVLRAIREAGGIRIDPRLAGECKWFFSNPGLRRHYQRADGLTIDEVGELLLDRGFVSESPTEREVIDILTDLFSHHLARSRRRSERQENAAEISAAEAADHAIEVRRKTRMRLYVCSGCGQKLRAATDDLTAMHKHVDPDTDEETLHPFELRTPRLITKKSVPF